MSKPALSREFTILRAWPALLAFLVSQAVLSSLGFLYHQYMWKWAIFVQLTERYEASIPQILLFDVLGFILPTVIAARMLNRKPKDLGLSAPSDIWTWGVAILLAATLFVGLGGANHMKAAFTVIGANLFIYQVIIAVSEEGFFRGFLQSEFVKGMGRLWGSVTQILLSTIAPAIVMSLVNEWGVKHIAVNTLVFTLPLGIIATLLRNMTGGIWAGTIARVALGFALVLSR